jgi:L-malate glycosyltransferase
MYARLGVGSRYPVVTVLHSASRDFDNLKLRTMERILSSRTALVVAVSQARSDEYVERFDSRVPIRVIPNGVRADLPQKREGTTVPRQIVTMARVNSQKDPRTWRDAALLVLAECGDLVFQWVGPASSDKDLQGVLSDASDTSIRFAGPTQYPGAVLEEADIYFHSALAEAHPLAVLEAAAVGLPIVCSNTVAKTIPEGLPAGVFTAGDPVDASRKLLHVVHDYPVAARHALAWRARIADDYSLARACAGYGEVLAQALTGHL